MWKKLKSIEYQHWIALSIVLGTAALGVFVYQYPFLRIFEALNDFCRSIVYAFTSLIYSTDEPPFMQTVNNFSAVDLSSSIGIDFIELSRKLTSVWPHVFESTGFRTYLIFLLYHFTRFILVVCWILIFALAFAMPIILTWDNINNNYNKDTKPLQLFKRWVVRPYHKVAEWCKDFWCFFRYSKWWTCFLIMWLLYFGVFTIIVEFFAYYFWLLAAFDITTIGIQLLKLIVDVVLMFNTLPWFVWVAIGLWLFDKWRLKHGMSKLYHMEARNKGMLNELPMCSFIVAPPRTGKDMLQTDMAITLAALDRDHALETLNENMMKFPRFPWILLELEVQQCIKDGTIRSWVNARNWINARYLTYAFSVDPEKIWNYDVEQYPYEFNDGLKIITIWNALSEYVQAYFTYTLTTSYIVSNYPIRDDFIIMDCGNLPMVDTNFLSRDPERIEQDSQYSHIIDWDIERLGRRIIQDNPNVGALEFAVKVFTEIDKERKNNDQLKETKANAEECNQKNDLFNLNLKMSGHKAMLNNRCYLHVLTNAQRPSSWGADAHELCTTLHIEKHQDTCNTLPLFWAEHGIIDKYLSWWNEVWDNSRFKWGDHHLLTWLGQGLAAVLFRYITRRNNRFGYYTQKITCEHGTLENQKIIEEKKYYIMFKKAYAERYASDYFRSFAELQTEKCPGGINQLPTYTGKYPTVTENRLQHSFLIRDLFKYHGIPYHVEEQTSYEATDENLDIEDFNRAHDEE
ncbi:MAG: hypothetical protein IKC97_08665 [Clostridia bacterium]|nr:hypothetical protein [Clostridia bacterium]